MGKKKEKEINRTEKEIQPELPSRCIFLIEI